MSASDEAWGDPRWIAAAWVLPALTALLWYSAVRRAAGRRAIADTALWQTIGAGKQPVRGVVGAAALLAGTGFLIAGLARPQGEPVETVALQRDHDVVFLLDVSRSMLAEDVRPTRLNRAKSLIHDALDTLGGSRTGLSVFAGSTVARCPLTRDQGFFRLTLKEAGPEAVGRGGSLLGDAVRDTLDRFFPADSERANTRDLIILSDGEDHDSFPAEAGALAHERGVRIIAIGLGTDTEPGAKIPLPGKPGAFVTHNGATVRTKLDAEPLQRLTDATPGSRYFHVAQGAIELDTVLATMLRRTEIEEVESADVLCRKEYFQIFLLAALLCFIVERTVCAKKHS